MTTQTETNQIMIAVRLTNIAQNGGTPPTGWREYKSDQIDKLVNSGSGYQAKVFVNDSTKEVFIANAGTNDFKDVKSWPTVITGGNSPQFSDALKVGQQIDLLVKGELPGDRTLQGYTVNTSGYSWGEGMAQLQAYTFGWKGVGFDGVGAGAIVKSAGYQSLTSDLNITPAGQAADFISCNTAGVGPFGGGVVGSLGADISGTRSCTIELPSSTGSGVLNALVTFSAKTPAGLIANFVLSKLIAGVSQHDIRGLDQAVTAGNFSVKSSGQTATPTYKPYSFTDDDGNILRTRQDVNGNLIFGTDGKPQYELILRELSQGRTTTIEFSGAGLPKSSIQTTDQDRNGTVDQTTTRNWLTDNVYQTDTFLGPPAPNTSPSTSGLNFGPVTYNLLDLAQRANAEYELRDLYKAGVLSQSNWYSFTSSSSSQLLGGPSGPGLNPGGGGYGLKPPADWLVPIGAFYDSQSTGFDNAASIASRTTRALNANGQALSAAQLAALDTNGDGQLSTSEASGVRLWADGNENGTMEAGELLNVGSAIKATDYGFYTQGNGRAAAPSVNAAAAPVVNVPVQRPQSLTSALPGAPAPAGLPAAPAYGGVPFSNYRTLRDTDNLYVVNGGFITFTASMIKINFSNRTYLIGTEGADRFDANYYASYPQYFDSSKLVNFLAGAGNDMMGGSIRNDNLWGGTGNDTLWGYGGDDRVYGEEGNDILFGDEFNGPAAGNDSLDGGAGNDTLFGQVGNDTLWGGEGDDRMIGFTASDEAQQSLYAGQTDNDVLMGEGGNDTLAGGVGQDLLDGGTGDDLVDGGDGSDTLRGGTGNDLLQGQAGQDVLDAGDGNDIVLAGQDNDSVWGGAGNDELQGNDGHDALVGEAGHDRMFGQVGNDSLWGGEGNDLLMGFTGDGEPQQALFAGQTDDDVLMGEGGNDTLTGGVGQDLLDGGSGDDLVDGGAGSDTLQGGSGNDQLQGQAGQDVLDAGDGNDIVLAGQDNDTVWGGAGNDELQGNEGHDVLTGEAGNDRMFGQVGNDSLLGGDGDDLLVGFTAGNEAKQTLSAGESDDDVLSGGAGNDNIFAGVGNDQLLGDAGNDLLLAEDGNDSLWGGEGSDELQGGAGQDQMDGGSGDDKLFGQVGNDTIWGGDGNDLLMGFTAGNETKQSLNAGETDDDVLYGGAGSDVLMGGLGQDQLYGGADRDELQGGEGNDVLLGEGGNDNLFGQVGNDTMYGGDGDDYIQGFTGSNEVKQSLSAGETDDDFLYGGAGSDTLVGGVGNDYLDGGAGTDQMIGGLGDDVYVVNSVNDVIYEKASQGYDTVITNSNYLLNANIEELRLLEGFNIHGTGNALNNRIIGNSADNILDGVTGADTMIGGAGHDTYYVDNAGDVVSELASEGTDTVQSSISHTLGSHMENLVLLDFSKPEKGLVDGKKVLVYGYPKRNELDYMQGDAVENYAGTCAGGVRNSVCEAVY
jgi:Ca2+-binding RTX toxin-like protein